MRGKEYVRYIPSMHLTCLCYILWVITWYLNAAYRVFLLITVNLMATTCKNFKKMYVFEAVVTPV